MSEEGLDAILEELENSSTELHNFVAVNANPFMSDTELDNLVRELSNDSLSLREFVMNVLEEAEG